MLYPEALKPSPLDPESTTHGRSTMEVKIVFLERSGQKTRIRLEIGGSTNELEFPSDGSFEEFNRRISPDYQMDNWKKPKKGDSFHLKPTGKD